MEERSKVGEGGRSSGGIQEKHSVLGKCGKVCKLIL